jgi:hypothetical protein
MTDLSPQTQAVLDAFTGNDTIYGLHLMTPRLAAALRAAADQVVPPLDVKPQEDLESRREAMEWGMNCQTQLTRHQLIAIAAELEAHQ